MGSLLFAGLLINRRSVPVYVGWLFSTSWFHATLEALIVNELRGLSLKEVKVSYIHPSHAKLTFLAVRRLDRCSSCHYPQYLWLRCTGVLVGYFEPRHHVHLLHLSKLPVAPSLCEGEAMIGSVCALTICLSIVGRVQCQNTEWILHLTPYN